MNVYEEKRQARIERYKKRAERAKQRSNEYFEVAHKMAEIIPFGQPVLVGHHSERRDRNFRGRIHNKFTKSYEESNKAKYWEERAKAAESNKAISSDDPEAIIKLKTKIEKAEKLQEIMKSANRIIRKKGLTQEEKVEKIITLGLSSAIANQLFTPDFCGRIGFADYQLQNNNANIRRMKQRLADLDSLQNAEETKQDYEGFQVIENVEENRIQIIFNGKDVYFKLCKERDINLRSYGFKYSKFNNAWQRHLNNAGRAAVERVVKKIMG